MAKDFLRLSDDSATIAERIGAELGWLWGMVVAAADSEWDVGGRKDGGWARVLMAAAPAPRCAGSLAVRLPPARS
jgi:hypothetical protein